MHVAIIGAGYAGMAAAAELAARGVRVSVFEASRTLGGRARRVEAHGHPLDNGQHILVGAYAELLRLMRLVGADPQALLERLPLSLLYPGPPAGSLPAALAAPAGTVAPGRGSAAARGASLAEKIGCRSLPALAAAERTTGSAKTARCRPCSPICCCRQPTSTSLLPAAVASCGHGAWEDNAALAASANSPRHCARDRFWQQVPRTGRPTSCRPAPPSRNHTRRLLAGG
jgi:hypothetical protein